jgi:hypothetical protein
MSVEEGDVAHLLPDESEDEADWDEVDVPIQPEHPELQIAMQPPQEEKALEITLKARPGTGKEKEEAARSVNATAKVMSFYNGL